jgi:hypothetical protein
MSETVEAKRSHNITFAIVAELHIEDSGRVIDVVKPGSVLISVKKAKVPRSVKPDLERS